MDVAQGDVLLEARVNQWDAQTRRGKAAGRKRLVDAGDHVEWTDGKTTVQWVLPGQAPDRPDLPVLAKVVLVEYLLRTYDNNITNYRLLLVDRNGHVLAIVMTADLFGVQHPAIEDLHRMWPESGLHALAERGVPYVAEEFDDVARMAEQYPGSIDRSSIVAFSTKSSDLVFIGAGVILAAGAIALLIWWIMQS